MVVTKRLAGASALMRSRVARLAYITVRGDRLICAMRRKMIPITPEKFREQVKRWPVDNLRQAIRAALSNLDARIEPLFTPWLLADVTDPQLPLGANQIAAIWKEIQRRAW